MTGLGNISPATHRHSCAARRELLGGLAGVLQGQQRHPLQPGYVSLAVLVQPVVVDLAHGHAEVGADVVRPWGIQAEHGEQDTHVDPFAVHVRQIRLWAEVGLDRRSQDLLVGGVGKEVGTVAQDRTPPDLQAVQAARANTDLLVQWGGQALLPEVWRLHHMPVTVNDFVWTLQGDSPPRSYGPHGAQRMDYTTAPPPNWRGQ
jgi:hypothetical protein